MCGYATASSPMDAKAAKKREMEYRGEDDHRTMTRAAEIEGDAERMTGVRNHHMKQTSALARVGKRFTGRRSSQRA